MANKHGLNKQSVEEPINRPIPSQICREKQKHLEPAAPVKFHFPIKASGWVVDRGKMLYMCSYRWSDETVALCWGILIDETDVCEKWDAGWSVWVGGGGR